MADFVLVHGAWHGAWCWKKIIPGLWAAGHRAFTVTLTGLGERSHLLAPGITLGTHVQDVLGLIEAEELEGAVLVGHSYGGMVITGVADQVAQEKLSRLVYLDAVVPEPGDSWSTGHSAETQAARRKAAAQSGVLPPPDPDIYGLKGADHAWVKRRQAPQPGGTYDAPLAFEPARARRWPRHYVDCNQPALATIDPSRRRAREQAGWTVHEIATGHDAMVSAPQALLDLLLGLPRA